MHKSRLGALIIDCQTDDLIEQAGFWGSALGLEVESLQGQRNTKYIRLEGKSGDIQILLQQVDHSNRIHLDIETDNIEAEVKRLESLGAEIVSKLERWTVMQAPSGHRFCVISPVRDGLEEQANAWE